MPGSGTDTSRPAREGGPVIILVEPQLGENIGMAARAMANFGLSEMRLVRPRGNWKHQKTIAAAANAAFVVEAAQVFPDLNMHSIEMVFFPILMPSAPGGFPPLWLSFFFGWGRRKIFLISGPTLSGP